SGGEQSIQLSLKISDFSHEERNLFFCYANSQSSYRSFILFLQVKSFQRFLNERILEFSNLLPRDICRRTNSRCHLSKFSAFITIENSNFQHHLKTIGSLFWCYLILERLTDPLGRRTEIGLPSEFENHDIV